MSKNLAPHVQAAIQRSAAPNEPAQPSAGAGPPAAPTAPHVQAAIQRHAGAPTGAQPHRKNGPAPHIASAVARPGPAAQAKEDGGGSDPARDESAKPALAQSPLHVPTDYVTYVDVKTGGTLPPPPKRPVYALHRNDGHSALQDIKTGRMREAGDIYGGFVRMGKGSPIYVSPRAAPGAPGDSHPSIASATPEWQAGKQAVVAAGEIGILGGEIVGHNDKTGHFMSRKNLRQSGLPSDRFHPFTEDPKDWYRK